MSVATAVDFIFLHTPLDIGIIWSYLFYFALFYFSEIQQ